MYQMLQDLKADSAARRGACLDHIRRVPNPTNHGPKIKIRGSLAKLPLSTKDITNMSAALKQLCVYLKFHDTQEQQRPINSDFMDIPPWVSYWLQSGVYPLIILAMVVFASIDMILYVG